MDKNTFEVIVIGAGASGIAAATKLLENGIDNLLVLEAENRIGGRIYTIDYNGINLDLGAEWCHGQDNNIVYQLVKDFNVLKHRDPHTDIYLSSGEKLDPAFSEDLFQIMDDVLINNDDTGAHHSVNLGQYCLKKYNRAINAKFLNDKKKLKIAEECIDFLEHSALCWEAARSWYDCSSDSEYIHCEGDLDLTWKEHGYKFVLDVMMDKFPDVKDKILLGTEVTRILWDNHNGDVIINTLDGATYETKRVVVTVSLGVLKYQHKEMFYPELPVFKQDAFKSMGAGGTMKLLVYFQCKWWGDTFRGVSFIWSSKDIEAMAKEFPYGPINNNVSWLTKLCYFVPLEQAPNFLESWITGDMVEELETLTDDILLNGIYFVLSRILAKTFKVTKPEKVFRYPWMTNRHFRCTYCYQKFINKKCEEHPQIILAKSVQNSNGHQVLFFAGEATDLHFYSTVHGAIESGYREANKIINAG